MARVLATGSGVVLDLIRTGRARTRTDLIEHLGWSRITLARRLDELLDASIIVSAGQLDSRGGRPPEEFVVNKDAGLLLSFDIGRSHTRLGLTDLASTVLIEDEADIGFQDGPTEIFEWAPQVVDYMLAKIGRRRADIHGVGVGVPGPVDALTGRLAAPQPDERWQGLALPDLVKHHFPVVCAMDRDVNIMAVAESRLGWPEYHDLVILKVGLGVSCALVLDGRIYRGSRGGAGDLSHPLRTAGEPRTLEAEASGAMIRRALVAKGHRIRTSADIVSLAASGNTDALHLLATAGRTIGDAIVGIVAMLNPEAVVVGGNLAEADRPFLSEVRAAILGGVPDFARTGLVVEPARLGGKAGVIGASLIAQDALFEPDRISHLTRSKR
ncbi:ROK family protein [Phytoactinopolyspora limicola]|uniref:ROK family protein n=1 Tax=Phytoactinopolyspora limicola TaxID=2715536 RepID=UPI00140A8171|nr:ROK family protein [Phytoactinopolyspora limicola]